MTDIEAINGTQVCAPTDVREVSPQTYGASRGIGIAAIPVTLEGEFFDLKLRAPGIVRACAFWLKKPTVLASAMMRAVEMVAHPLLMVEMDPAGEIRTRRFAFLPSDNVLQVKAGYEARYCATAVGQHGAAHLFEIVELGA